MRAPCFPQYPNNSDVPWDTWATVEQCTTAAKPGCLFDIIADPMEHTDLALAQPATVQALLDAMRAAQAGVYDPERGAPSPAACMAVATRYNGFWGPFLNLSTTTTTTTTVRSVP